MSLISEMISDRKESVKDARPRIRDWGRVVRVEGRVGAGDGA